MPISTEDLALSGANDAQRSLRRLVPLVYALRRALLNDGTIIICEACGGKGYLGAASLTDCHSCEGGGVVPKTSASQ